ncbi:uncharacterized protein LOC131619694 [Vicia villosa]|uniref:uncharacterized protein LOC131619694 n=1 Tax=Vicia villosa TaxID=3911 RepID=UPI00273C3305|nr:uncharacterized protein LOC131619694 [Vicia villosa]
MSVEENITLGLPTKIKLIHCPQCNFYLRLPRIWIKLESTIYLSFCLTKLKFNISSYDEVKVLDAERVPFECDSKIFKARVYVQKEVTNGEPLKQSYVVDFLQDDCVCEPCSEVQANPGPWLYVVQLRRHGSHARSFLQLEHVIMKHAVVANAERIQKMKNGTDFAFDDEVCARKLVDFITKQAPVRVYESKGVISDIENYSHYSCGYTFFVQVCSICCEDLIFLPPSVASSLGNIGPVMICSRLTSFIGLFDPLTSKQTCIGADGYWGRPFLPLLTRKDLVEYVVLDVDEVYIEVTLNNKIFGLANAEVARVNDLGENDTTFKIKTHLAHLLRKGDHALGYDLWEAECSDSDIELKDRIEGGVILMKTITKEQCRKRRLEQQPHLKDLEKITNDVLGMSLGSEEPTLEEQLEDLNLCDEEYKEKKKARRMA